MVTIQVLLLLSNMSADPVPLSDVPACTVQLYQHACWVHLSRYMCLKSVSPSSFTNPPDMPTGKVRLPQGCKTYQLPAWTPS